MDKVLFYFDVTPHTDQMLSKQLVKALEHRSELLSRETYPVLWSTIDRLREKSGGKTRSRIRTRVMSILCLLLGLFLFIPGLFKPQELLIPLLVGAIATGAGVGGLWSSRKRKKNPFESAAEKLCSLLAAVKENTERISFTDREIRMENIAQNTAETISYDRFECCIETVDLYVCTFDEKIMVLAKQDLNLEEPSAFAAFLSAKIKRYCFVPEA